MDKSDANPIIESDSPPVPEPPNLNDSPSVAGPTSSASHVEEEPGTSSNAETAEKDYALNVLQEENLRLKAQLETAQLRAEIAALKAQVSNISQGTHAHASLHASPHAYADKLVPMSPPGSSKPPSSGSPILVPHPYYNPTNPVPSKVIVLISSLNPVAGILGMVGLTMSYLLGFVLLVILHDRSVSSKLSTALGGTLGALALILRYTLTPWYIPVQIALGLGFCAFSWAFQRSYPMEEESKVSMTQGISWSVLIAASFVLFFVTLKLNPEPSLTSDVLPCPEYTTCIGGERCMELCCSASPVPECVHSTEYVDGTYSNYWSTENMCWLANDKEALEPPDGYVTAVLNPDGPAECSLILSYLLDDPGNRDLVTSWSCSEPDSELACPDLYESWDNLYSSGNNPGRRALLDKLEVYAQTEQPARYFAANYFGQPMFSVLLLVTTCASTIMTLRLIFPCPQPLMSGELGCAYPQKRLPCEISACIGFPLAIAACSAMIELLW